MGRYLGYVGLNNRRKRVSGLVRHSKLRRRSSYLEVQTSKNTDAGENSISNSRERFGR